MTTSAQPSIPGSHAEPIAELGFTVSGRIARPCADVYEAVADPAQLSRYFTTEAGLSQASP